MSQNTRPENAVRVLRLMPTGSATSCPLVFQSAYSHVHRARVFARESCIKTFTTSTWNSQHSAALELMLGFLLDHLYANAMAYQHPKISFCIPIVIEEFDKDGGRSTIAYTTPWYDNGDIIEYMHAHPNAQKFKMVIHIAQAMEHLHKHNVVHGNIFPGNIFVTDSGQATVTDIGVYTLARQFLLRSYTPVLLVRSSVYQAPELLCPGTGAFVQPTKAMDVYALASTIFTVFTGKAPFAGLDPILTVGQAVARILIHGHLCLQKPNEGVSNELWELLRQCWAQDPLARPSIGNVVTALEDIELYHGGST